jgi:hypothetical protein
MDGGAEGMSDRGGPVRQDGPPRPPAVEAGVLLLEQLYRETLLLDREEVEPIAVGKGASIAEFWLHKSTSLSGLISTVIPCWMCAPETASASGRRLTESSFRS